MSDTNAPSARASGRFVLRIDRGLHSVLREAAREAGASLNEYCARKLAMPGIAAVSAPAAEIVTRAAMLFGEELLGVVAFGSWAREDLARESDVDVLVVVEPGVSINRELYRIWDAEVQGETLTWDSHPIEPHFLCLPEPGARISGLWAEAAVDGVALFDRDLSVSRRLVEIRRRIVEGKIVRRTAYGQPYWVEAA